MARHRANEIDTSTRESWFPSLISTRKLPTHEHPHTDTHTDGLCINHIFYRDPPRPQMSQEPPNVSRRSPHMYKHGVRDVQLQLGLGLGLGLPLMAMDVNMESATFSCSSSDRKICDTSARVDSFSSSSVDPREATSALLSDVLGSRWPLVNK